MMLLRNIAFAPCLFFVSLLGLGQTTVTTTSGATGTIPVFTGAATLGNSVITQQNSYIGIGTSTPAALFSVGSSSPFQINAAGLLSSTGGVNLVSYLGNTAVTYPGISSVVVFQPSLTANATLGGYASSNTVNSAMTGSFINNSSYFGVQNNHYKQTTGAGTQATATVETNGFEVGGGATSYGTVTVDSASANLYTTSASVTNLSLFNGVMSWNGGGYTGTVTNLYGLYLGNMTGATNSYAIYSAGGQSYFAGKVGIAVTTPAYQLDVRGGQINSSGGYCINGANCITAWPTGGSSTATANTWTAAQTFGSGANFPLGTWNSSGIVGIGTTTPMERLHVVDSVGIAAGVTGGGAFGNGNAVIQSSYGARTVGTGAALSFAFPANTDGSNVWEQARIVATPDNNTNSNAQGRLYLQTRYSAPGAWNWSNNIILTSDGSSTFGGNIQLTSGSGASLTYSDGTTQTTAWSGILSGGDYAESVDVVGDRGQYRPGDVLVVDPTSEGKFVKSAEPYSTAVMGIYSTRPGVVGRRQQSERSHMKDEVPMAMIGVVPTNVTAEGGSIKPGDLLVTSSKSGYAMKGSDRSLLTGAIIGKALGHLDQGSGVIEVAVSLQ